MMKPNMIVSMGLIVMSILLPNNTDAQSFADRVGLVAAHLFTTTVWTATAPSVPEIQAKAWDRILLDESKHPTNEVSSSFQNQGDYTYDAVRLIFDAPNVQSLETRQTIAVWTLTLDDQDTSGKTEQELASLVTSKAVGYLNAFANRSFSYEGLYDGIKVFVLSVDPGHETGDWRDSLWAIVDGSKIGYSCLKKQMEASAFRPTSAPDENRTWFSIVGAGSKTK
jgi:hypothetical protein